MDGATGPKEHSRLNLPQFHGCINTQLHQIIFEIMYNKMPKVRWKQAALSPLLAENGLVHCVH